MQQTGEIAMLDEMLDYLNAHQLRSLLDLNTQRHNGLQKDAKRYHTDQGLGPLSPVHI